MQVRDGESSSSGLILLYTSNVCLPAVNHYKVFIFCCDYHRWRESFGDILSVCQPKYVINLHILHCGTVFKVTAPKILLIMDGWKRAVEKVVDFVRKNRRKVRLLLNVL